MDDLLFDGYDVDLILRETLIKNKTIRTVDVRGKDKPEGLLTFYLNSFYISDLSFELAKVNQKRKKEQLKNLNAKSVVNHL